MSVTPVSRTAAPTTIVAGGGISSEGIMAYCAAQLNQLDTEIQSKMLQQQQHREATRPLADLKSKFSGDHLDGNNKEERYQILKDMKAAYDALPPNDPGRKQLDELFTQYVGTACRNDWQTKVPDCWLGTLTNEQIDTLVKIDNSALDQNKVVESEMKELCSKVDGIMNDISKGAELEMINLQSQVSQRQMAVQMATSMLNKFNEGLMSVAGNIGK
jgi:hypothetical protein